MKRVALIAALAVACGKTPTNAGIEVDITYVLRSSDAGCVRLTVLPEGLPESISDFAVSAPSGTVTFGVLQPKDWPAAVTLRGTLHSTTCDVAHVPGGLATVPETFVKGRIKTIPMTLEETIGGTGGGSAGGGVAGGGTAGGTAGGSAGGTAGGAAGGAAGGTAGGAAGGTAGGTAGGSSGPLTCDGGFQQHLIGGTPNLYAIAMVAPGDLWVGGQSPMRVGRREPNVADGGIRAASGCTDDSTSLAALASGRVYIGTPNSNDIQKVDAVPGSCVEAVTGIPSSPGNGMAAFPFSTGVELFEVNGSGQILRRGDGVSISDNTIGGTELWAIDGPRSLLFAAGFLGGSGKAVVMKNENDAGWAIDYNNANNGTTFRALSYVDPTHVYSAGDEGVVYRFDGGTWGPDLPALPFAIRGVQAYGPGSIYAVGSSGEVKYWNGATWSTVADFTSVTTTINAVRGTGVCDTWVVGNSGLVATTNRR